MNLALDADGDLDFTGGRLNVVTGTDAIVQRVLFRLRMFKGEWFLDDAVGMPYYDVVLVKAPDLLAIRSVIRQAILTTPGVAALDGFDVDFDRASRALSIRFSGTADDGSALDFSRRFVIV